MVILRKEYNVSSGSSVREDLDKKKDNLHARLKAIEESADHTDPAIESKARDVMKALDEVHTQHLTPEEEAEAAQKLKDIEHEVDLLEERKRLDPEKALPEPLELKPAERPLWERNPSTEPKRNERIDR
jgi:uncharacterized coiled-coil DUF342 family protein